MRMAGLQSGMISCVISFFSFFSASHFKRQDMKNLVQWIFKVLTGWTRIWCCRRDRPNRSSAIVSGGYHLITDDLNGNYFYFTFCRLMFGNFFPLVLTLSLAFHICRGGLGNKSGQKLVCRQPVHRFQDTVPTRDQWTTKPVVSFTHQDSDNSQHDAAHVILQFSVSQCSVQTVERVPGSQLQQNNHTHEEMKSADSEGAKSENAAANHGWPGLFQAALCNKKMSVLFKNAHSWLFLSSWWTCSQRRLSESHNVACYAAVWLRVLVLK